MTAFQATTTNPAAELQFITQVRLEQTAAEAQHLIGELSSQLSLTAAEMAVLLEVPERTFARRVAPAAAAEPSRFSKTQVERLLLLQGVAAHGLDVFEDQGKFNRWLRRPLPVLQQQSPLQLLDTVTGFRVVDQVLGRMEYGVYS